MRCGIPTSSTPRSTTRTANSCSVAFYTTFRTTECAARQIATTWSTRPAGRSKRCSCTSASFSTTWFRSAGCPSPAQASGVVVPWSPTTPRSGRRNGRTLPNLGDRCSLERDEEEYLPCMYSSFLLLIEFSIFIKHVRNRN